MTIEEVYLKFLQEVNRNFTNDNVSVDRGRFVLLINDAFNRFVEYILEKRNEDDIRYIQQILVEDQPLKKLDERDDYIEFELPDDFFDLSNISVYGSKGKCSNQRLLVDEIKDENREHLIADAASEPSFEYRETFYFLSNGKVKVFVSDFTIPKVSLSYYRYPIKVDIAGYTRPDKTPSTSINPEFDDKAINRVISIAAKNFDINSDGNKFNLVQQRVISKV